MTNLERLSVEYPSANEYPYSFGLNTLIMFGKVRYFCHLLWPPIDHDTPLFSMNTCRIFVANAPLPAVKESPIAAIISISPGRS